MRNLTWSAIVAASVAVSAPLSAQNGSHEDCRTEISGFRYETCQATVDIFDYIAPQLGALISGGNPGLGRGASVNGPYHITVSFRANLVRGGLPDLASYVPPGTYDRAEFDTRVTTPSLAVLDAAVDLFHGFLLGRTRVGGFSALVSGSYMREFSGGSTSVRLADGPFRIGYGARVRLRHEGPISPALAIDWVRRDMPRLNVRTRFRLGTLAVDDMKVRTSGWRLVASKSLAAFGLAAGMGRDGYESFAAIVESSDPYSPEEIAASRKVRRITYFGNMSTNVHFATLAAEIGLVSGGSIETFNSFGRKPSNVSRLFGSVGLRLGT